MIDPQIAVKQLGEIAVFNEFIKPDATVAYYFAGAEAGDHPPVADLLGALSSQ